MTPRTVRLALLSGVAVCLAGAALAQGSPAKIQDRLPMEQSAKSDRAVQMAALEVPFGAPPPAAPEGPRFAAGEPRPQGPDARRMGPPPGAERPMGHPGRRPMGPPPGPRPDPLAYARALAGAEAAIGIRADQLDAWRDLTDALQASAPPPAPCRPRRPAPACPQGTTAEGGNAVTPAPFGALEALAGGLQEQGRVGERIARAISTLKTKLTPEQMERLARIEPALLPPPPGGFPPPPPPPGGPGPSEED